jgi:Ca2+-binding EF-hand superfamily protein
MKIEKIGLFVLGITLVVNANAQDKDTKSSKEGDKKENRKINHEDFFAKTDLNEDGNLTLEEFYKALSDEKKADSKFKKIDGDGDKLISKLEFYTFHSAENKTEKEKKTDKELFGEKDKNGDGFIDLEELVNENGNKIKAETKLTKIDTDKDKKISIEEFLVHQQTKGIRPSPAERFKRIDVEGDGCITTSEFLASGDDRSEADEKSKEMDYNLDGKVTLDEFIKYDEEKEAKKKDQLNNPDKYFAEWDTNEDKSVSLEEYLNQGQKKVKDQKRPSVSTNKKKVQDLTKKFGKIDDNDDSIITKEELANWSKKQLKKEEEQKNLEKEQRMKKADAEPKSRLSPAH